MAQLIEATEKRTADAKDPMPLLGIDHIEFYVGNAKQAAFYYMHAFGFKQVAYSGLETGVRDRASYVLQQGRIRVVLTGGLRAGAPLAAPPPQHRDGGKGGPAAGAGGDHARGDRPQHRGNPVAGPHGP